MDLNPDGGSDELTFPWTRAERLTPLFPVGGRASHITRGSTAPRHDLHVHINFLSGKRKTRNRDANAFTALLCWSDIFILVPVLPVFNVKVMVMVGDGQES